MDWAAPVVPSLVATVGSLLILALARVLLRADPTILKRPLSPCEEALWAEQARSQVLMDLLVRYAPPPVAQQALATHGAASGAASVQRLVAVFPPSNLDVSAEQRVLREAGGAWELVILAEQDASRKGIGRELQVGRGCRLLYIAAHHADGRITLAGEPATAQWLVELIRYFGIEVLILNACDSDTLVESCLAAGARAVVSHADPIADSQAARWAVALIQGLARGDTLMRAVRYAALAVDDGTGATVRLRGDGAWKWAA